MADIKNIPLSKLQNWEKNPRDIDQSELDRLVAQIRDLGQYKPLIGTMEEDGRVTILGGNMRLQAFQQIAEVDNISEHNYQIMVSIVDAPTDKLKLKYALSDNDRAGYYKEDELVKLAREIGDFELQDYKIDTGYNTSLATIADRYDMADTRARGTMPTGEAPDVNTVKEKKEIYDNATIKQIVLFYGKDEYEQRLNLLDRVMTENELENNTEAADLMFRFYEENH